MSDVTRILTAIQHGNARAADELFPIVYQELRRLAAQRLSGAPPGQTLQSTALVHEAYIRLVKAEAREWESRGHFFASAAEAMRQILIDRARRKRRLKRGGDRKRVSLQDADLMCETAPDDLIALDEALSKLAEEEPLKADLVKLRYFGGLTSEEAAEVLSISRATAARYAAYARAWLYHEITKDDEAARR